MSTNMVKLLKLHLGDIENFPPTKHKLEIFKPKWRIKLLREIKINH